MGKSTHLRKRRSTEEIAKAWKLYGSRCEVCRAPGSSVDHVVELRDGGVDSVYNMQILCVPCHERKTKWNDFVRLPKSQQEQRRRDGLAPMAWPRNARKGVGLGPKRSTIGGG